MKECLGCHREIPEKVSTCPFCGIILAKWKPRLPRVEAPPPAPEPEIPVASSQPIAVIAQFTPSAPVASRIGGTRAVMTAIMLLTVLLVGAGSYLVVTQLPEIKSAATDRGKDDAGPANATAPASNPTPASETGEAAADSAEVERLLIKLREDSFTTRATADELIKLGAREQALKVLNEMLRDSDKLVQMRARLTLNGLGVPIGYDRYTRSSAVTSDEAKVVEASAEVKGDALYGSWRIHFGSDLFENNTTGQENIISLPKSAGYRVTVSGGSLVSPVVKEYEASPGDNTRTDELLASGLGPGEYKIDIFVHAQYVSREGVNKVLNSSMTPLEVEK